MSQPAQEELALLSKVASDLREVFSERGHRVGLAMEADPAFGSGWSRAALTRDLVVDAVSWSASRNGVDFRPVNGSGRELRFFSGSIDRRYRLRRATRRANGDIIIETNSDSALACVEESLFTHEPWALAWLVSGEGQIEEVLAAEIVDYIEGRPGHLELGQVITLGEWSKTDGEFRPTEEGLEGFDDEEDEGGTLGQAPS